MLIFLYGRDIYRSKENLDKIIAEFNRKYPSGLNFHSFDLSDPSRGSGQELDKFEDAVKSLSFFDEKKLVLIKNSFEKNIAKKTRPLTDGEFGLAVVNVISFL